MFMAPRITDSGAPPSLDDLEQTEERLGVRLPEDYRSFLLRQNGGKPTPAWFRHGEEADDVAEITRFFAREEMETQTRDLRQDSRLAGFVAIATSSDTDFLLLATAPEQRDAVFWWYDEDGSSEFIRVADSFEQLLTNLDYPE